MCRKKNNDLFLFHAVRPEKGGGVEQGTREQRTGTEGTGDQETGTEGTREQGQQPVRARLRAGIGRGVGRFVSIVKDRVFRWLFRSVNGLGQAIKNACRVSQTSCFCDLIKV